MKKYTLLLIFALAAILRLWHLGQVPPSLYWDEASLGYNAYSILKTAHDEHGRFLPVTNFAAFGDYKPPGYIYSAVIPIAILGPNELAVRFPSALAGTIAVFITYLLVNILFKNRTIALLASFFLAISPWHLQLSRGAFEANLGLLFSLMGIYFFVKFADGSRLWLPFSVLTFLLAMYTFTGQRLFVPFMLLVLSVQFRKQIINNLLFVSIVSVIATFLFWPLFKFATFTIEGKLRFNEVTIFKDLDPINESIKYREVDDFHWLSGIIHNRRLFYTHEYLKHYFDAFNPDFLFTKGDVNPRLSIQELGELYYFDLIFAVAGLYFLFSKKYKYSSLIFGWLLISPLGPASARETPHALRMAHVLPVYQILSAIGIYHIATYFKFKKIIIALTFVSIIAIMFYYLHIYFEHWPKAYSGQWQYGYKEATSIAKAYYDKVDNIFVTKQEGRPYIYFLLHMKFDPNLYHQSSSITKDEFFFLDIQGFDKFKFVTDDTNLPAINNSLYILGANKIPEGVAKITTIKNLEGKSVFDVGLTSSQ